jgi:hypothetical protein
MIEPGGLIAMPGSIISNGAGGNPFVTNPDRTAADATGVYWTNAGTARDSQDGSVIVCAQAGCGSLGPTVLASGLPRPRGIAIDDAYVYWANEGLSTNPNGGTVMRVPKRGGRAETIASQQGAPVYLATDTTTLWWTSRGDGVVMTWSKSGGAAQVFADAQAGAWDIAVDDSGVYWTTWGPSGAVSMCPKSGCDAGVVVLASGLNEPYGIATDDKAVYWTSFDPSNGAVMMIAKP